MTDYILGSDGQKIPVRNPFNLGGFEATLQRWYEAYKAGEISEDDAQHSIRFDGVMVWRKWDNFSEMKLLVSLVLLAIWHQFLVMKLI